jgi:ketosteroid isomerase-like protein
MSTDANKELVRRFYAAVDAGDTAAVPELFAPEWQNIDPSLPPMQGLDGARTLVGMFTASFPDFTSRVELIAAEDERVAVRASHTGHGERDRHLQVQGWQADREPGGLRCLRPAAAARRRSGLESISD